MVALVSVCGPWQTVADTPSSIRCSHASERHLPTMADISDIPIYSDQNMLSCVGTLTSDDASCCELPVVNF
jgi:hypothetical protein